MKEIPPGKDLNTQDVIRLLGLLVCGAIFLWGFFWLETRDKPADPPLPVSTNVVHLTNAPARK